MARSFETSDSHSNPNLRPIRVPTRSDHIYAAAKEMVDDLDGWEVLSADDENMRITCRRPGGMLGGDANVVVTVEGPEGIPSATVHVSSSTEGGFRARDKANVEEFIKPFTRRVC